MDSVWEIQQADYNQTKEVWTIFEKEARNRKEAGDFDEIFLTQIPPNNFQNYDGTSRSSLFRGYPHPITVPVQPVVWLTQSEVEAVRIFASVNNLRSPETAILIEAASTSGQSYVTPKFALAMAEIAATRNADLTFIISSDQMIEVSHNRIIDASALTLRENAELTKYCGLLVGCSSGISWIATSDWAKPLPQIQLLNGKTRMFASMLHDAKYFGLPTDNILELVDVSPDETAEVILSVMTRGFAHAHSLYQRDFPLRFDFYFSQIYHELLSRGLFLKAARALSCAFERYRYSSAGIDELKRTIRSVFTPYLHLLWDTLNKTEQAEFVSLGYQPVARMSMFHTWKTLFRLCILSIYSEDIQVARLFLAEIVKKYVWKILMRTSR
ncbi:MAG: hypothetical protein HY562_11505 [Ignavibacteriales bacterium]|nr:hypothetical protein [Ignavibacteriales bacterium]